MDEAFVDNSYTPTSKENRLKNGGCLSANECFRATPVTNPRAAISRRVSVIGACVNEGQDWYHGVETAPRAFREAGLLDVIKSMSVEVVDGGDIEVNTFVKASDGLPDSYYACDLIKKGAVIGDACGRLHGAVMEHCQKGNFVLTLGGDHSVAAGTISAIKRCKKDIAVVWVDAHADCNTPLTSPSGNFHGMPVGLLLGWFEKKADRFAWIEEYLKSPLDENRLAFVGLRDVDEAEKALLRKSKIVVYSMHEVERLGIAQVMEEVIAKVSPGGLRPIHLSFDIDGIDPIFAPGTGTRARGGLNYREARYICTRLAETGALESMDLVEVNPTIDVSDPVESDHGENPNVNSAASMTVKLGIDLIQFALGKTLV